MIGLSLWMALPAFQWCSTTSLCRAGMGVECESASNDFAMSPCPLDGECPVSGSGDSGLWCVGPHADGLTPREIIAPPLDVAMPFEASADPAPPAPLISRIRPESRAGLCPGVNAPHAPPLTRAPPLAPLDLAKLS